jgi:hypothetical protein
MIIITRENRERERLDELLSVLIPVSFFTGKHRRTVLVVVVVVVDGSQPHRLAVFFFLFIIFIIIQSEMLRIPTGSRHFIFVD